MQPDAHPQREMPFGSRSTRQLDINTTVYKNLDMHRSVTQTGPVWGDPQGERAYSL